MHKLSEDEVLQIRGMLLFMTQREIAELFDVHQVTISHIKTGKTWAWLQ